MKRVAIFQYDWPIQSYSKDLAEVLRDHDIKVDFFGYQLDEDRFLDLRMFNTNGISFYKFNSLEEEFDSKSGNINKFKFKFLWHYISNYLRYLFKPAFEIINRNVLFNSYKKLLQSQYDVFIGIEKAGLIWAGELSRKLKVPLIYYSLELYIDNHPMLKYQGHLREAERYFHKRSIGTIIQDELRERALSRANNVKNHAVYLPVSLRGPGDSKKSSFLHDKLKIDPKKKIVLFFGGFAPNRYCSSIVKAAQDLDDHCQVVFHGFEVKEGYVKQLKTMDNNGKVIFSMDMIDENELGALISSASIGFCIYNNDNLNDRFTAFSSQKLAYFLKYSVPIISNCNESFERLFNEFNCGVAIDQEVQINEAINRILDNIELYSSNASMAYEKYFNLDNLASELIEELNKSIDRFQQ